MKKKETVDMSLDDRYALVLDYFRKRLPTVTTELEFGSVFQLLVATMLSAQCTDKRINQVTPELFRHYPDAKTMAQADEDDLFDLIRSVSYPHSKARHLSEMAKRLVDDYGGEVPETLEKLTSLPGVGRKTANVVQAVAFGKPTMAVDTHVYRVSHRLGLASEEANTPYKVEMELTRHIPEADIPRAHHWLLLHGRYVCTSRNPKCNKCDLSNICPSSNILSHDNNKI